MPRTVVLAKGQQHIAKGRRGLGLFLLPCVVWGRRRRAACEKGRSLLFKPQAAATAGLLPYSKGISCQRGEQARSLLCEEERSLRRLIISKFNPYPPRTGPLKAKAEGLALNGEGSGGGASVSSL
jgi:hypothetical protein